MENLNKENFFNEMTEKYPRGMKLFCDWIDEYKKSVNWAELFNAGRLNPGRDSIITKAPKFHDLPYEMQFGIFLKFSFACLPIEAQHYNFSVDEMKNILIDLFKGIEAGKL